MLLSMKSLVQDRLILPRQQRHKVGVKSAQCVDKLPLLHKRKPAIIALILLYCLATSQIVPASESGADRVLVIKSERKLYLLREGQPYRSYPVSLGSIPWGHKQFAGDERTPEGVYWLEYKNSSSPYYRSIRISYPNDEDRMRARAMGRDPGGDIMIHGQPLDSDWSDEVALLFNWTNGCIAVSNEAMEDIWAEVAVGTLIEIRP